VKCKHLLEYALLHIKILKTPSGKKSLICTCTDKVQKKEFEEFVQTIMRQIVKFIK
jgi:hypothetical protein